MSIDYIKLASVEAQKKQAALCLIVSTAGDTPRRAGSKMIVYEDGSSEGTVGGGNVEHETIEQAKRILNTRKPELFEFTLKDDLDMICGGAVSVYIEPICKTYPLYIFGAGHVGKMIARYACDFGFDVTLIDMRPEMFEQIDQQRIHCWTANYIDTLDQLPYSPTAFFIITTPRHQYDEQLLAVLASKENGYIGMMASKIKVAAVREKFTNNQTLTPDQLDRIDMPIGIPFACETPAEIAISVVARLIDVKNKMEGYVK